MGKAVALLSHYRTDRGSDLGLCVTLRGVDGEVWCVYADGELLGEIEIEEHDMPWNRGRFRSQPAFEQVRPLFDDWNRAVDSGDPELIDRAYQAIRASVRMTYPDGRPVPEFMLGIEGDSAGFRWADERFET